MLGFSDLLLLVSFPQHKAAISDVISVPMQFVGLIIEDLEFAVFDRVGRHPSASKAISTARRLRLCFKMNALQEQDCRLNSCPLIWINIVAAIAADEKIISYAVGTAR